MSLCVSFCLQFREKQQKQDCSQNSFSYRYVKYVWTSSVGLRRVVLGSTEESGCRPGFYCFCRGSDDITAKLELPHLESTRNLAILWLQRRAFLWAGCGKSNFRPGRCLGGAAECSRASPLRASTAFPPASCGGLGGRGRPLRPAPRLRSARRRGSARGGPGV